MRCANKSFGKDGRLLNSYLSVREGEGMSSLTKKKIAATKLTVA